MNIWISNNPFQKWCEFSTRKKWRQQNCVKFLRQLYFRLWIENVDGLAAVLFRTKNPLMKNTTYLSASAVLKLDAILTNARKVTTIPAKKNANQKPLDKMILMEYNCVDIGIVMMTGIPSRFQEHVTGSGM